MSSPVLFNAIDFPLNGTRLIEASAGTGKTYSLCNLYIRLLIGHNTTRAYRIDEILVLTFTRAATRELKERIYDRILESIQVFETNKPSKDIFLQQLKSSIEAENYQRIINQLRYASTLIDQSSVFTIDSFCQRLIDENRHTLKVDEQAEVVINASDNIHWIMLDVWRLLSSTDNSPLMHACISETWRSFDAFSKQYRQTLDSHLNTDIAKNIVDYPCSLFQAAGNSVEKLESAIHYFKKLWIENLNEINGFFSSETIKYYNNYKRWIEKVNHYAQSESDFTSILPNGKDDAKCILAKFTYIQLEKQLKIPSWLDNKKTLIEATEDLFTQAESLSKLKNKIQQWALYELRHRWKQHKQDSHLFQFNDLRIVLSQALDQTRFRQKVQTRFPIALIDEFQDTDDLQYSIFSKIYQNNEGNLGLDLSSDLGLFLIGDPKQAIYKFRGADLNTYINAKKSVPSNHQYILDTNWRSTPQLIDAFNTLFNINNDPFKHSDIPYYDVKSKIESQDAQTNTANSNKQHLHFIFANGNGENLNQDASKKLLFESCAQKIHDLLQSNHTINGKPIEEKDICILVRQNDEGTKLQAWLKSYGLSSSFADKKQSVYQSNCAYDLVLLLSAWLNPKSKTHLHSLAASQLYQQSLSQFNNNDEHLQFIEQLQNDCYLYQEHQKKYGILSALFKWSIDTHFYQTQKTTQISQRYIADFQHLAQLLQDLETTTGNFKLLFENFYQLVFHPNNQSNSDAQQLRLETDQSLIQITTIHSSKGLQYPIVFWPYACQVKSKSSDIVVEQSDNEQTHLKIDFDIASNQQSLIQSELAENLRLLYVALTRAQYACYIGFARITSYNKAIIQDSALGHIFDFKDETINSDLGVENYLDNLCKHSAISYESVTLENIEKRKIELGNIDHSQTSRTNNHLLLAPPSVDPIKLDFKVNSFSSLARHYEENRLFAYKEDKNKSEEALETKQQEQTIESSDIFSAPTIHQFPKGASIGEFLHNILEDINFSDASAENIRLSIEKNAYNYGLQNLLPQWNNLLENWISCIIKQPILSKNNHCFALSDLKSENYIAELHFYFSVPTPIKAQEFNSLLSQYGYLNNGQHALSFESFQGLMTGFIDLTFEFDNQFFILDYKSNHLGLSQESYSNQQLQQCIHSHHYDVQYLLYTLALHRLLKQNKGSNYDYEKHIGGCVYYFLRGVAINQPTPCIQSSIQEDVLLAQHGVFFDRPQPSLIEALDQLFS